MQKINFFNTFWWAEITDDKKQQLTGSEKDS